MRKPQDDDGRSCGGNERTSEWSSEVWPPANHVPSVGLRFLQLENKMFPSYKNLHINNKKSFLR